MLEEPGPPRTHRWRWGAFLLSFAVFLFASQAIVVLVQGPDGKTGSVGLFLALSVPPLLAAAVGVVATIVRGNGPWVDLRLEWRWRDVTSGLAFGIAGLGLTLMAARVWTYFVGDKNATSAVGSLLDGIQMSPALAVLVFLQVWLISPICEEIIYRGLLWGAIERENWGRFTAFVLTTVVFACSHLEPSRTPLLLIISLPLGLSRLITDRLLTSIVTHQVNNFLPALGLLLGILGVLPP
ncbi:CPBP family intramembrane metalloprotease [Pseudonocardiaceae bacterium YIM PH 21723]|nr:CPBP family intramembrane metalloprotease [Pseudonocardiaceae bacterium YIM PH 21723]